MALAKLFIMSGLVTFISALLVTSLYGLYQVIALIISVVVGSAVAYYYANKII